MQESLFGLDEARTPTTRRSVAGRIQPILKWPGGKKNELDKILAAAPPTPERYFEPFVGGGAVYWSVEANVPAFINDTSTELIGLYRYAQAEDANLFSYLEDIARWWDQLGSFTQERAGTLVDLFEERRDLEKENLTSLVNDLVKENLEQAVETVPSLWQDLSGDFEKNVVKLVPRKVARMRKVERDRQQELPKDDVWANVEGAYKACAYTSLRTAYNVGRASEERSSRQVALFFYLREYAYAAMFRFSKKGEFNVPYGGISYNRKPFGAKVDHLRSTSVKERLVSTVIGCQDFEAFLEEHQPGRNDWLFLDPPYDSDFSSYDNNLFGQEDHRRLASVMASVDSKVQLVIKATPAVLEIYSNDLWNILAFDKRYLWTIKERNDRNATHLMITNYDPPQVS